MVSNLVRLQGAREAASRAPAEHSGRAVPGFGTGPPLCCSWHLRRYRASGLAAFSLGQWTNARKAAETLDDEEVAHAWLDERLAYLPGETRPEKWIIRTLRGDLLTDLQTSWRTDEATLGEALREADQAGKHNELWTLAKELELTEDCVSSGVAQHLVKNHAGDFEPIIEAIKALLK